MSQPLDEPGVLETDEILVRKLEPADLEAVIAVDAAASGRRRPMYLERMVRRAVEEADFQVSLAAEVEGRTVGFALATLYYGEYGVTEPSASIDAIGVAPEFRGRKVGRALLRQLLMNYAALRIERVRTEVAWNNANLLAFFERVGFAPAGRICLERQLDPTAPEI
ncbi:MAG: GNAT family N-acetyltransferase [Thermoanaerobaculia bacterium]|nr:GNAT family N-acetyltransferase [Thermoanaerobaculia bacterium]